MADRQGFENNDFSGGLTDEYVALKDNRLEAANNLCLDYDMTPIQRPGTGKLSGSNTSFGKIADQDGPIVGLIARDDKLIAFTTSKAHSYTSGPAFVKEESVQDRLTPQNIFYDIKEYSQSDLTPEPYVPCATGTINGFSKKNIIYAVNNTYTHPKKFLTTSYGLAGTDFSGPKVIPVGLPRMMEMIISDIFSSPIDGYINHVAGAGGCTFRLGHVASSSSVVIEANSGTTKNDISDIPIKTTALGSTGYVDLVTYSHSYLLSFVFRINYYVDGVRYTKRSRPSTPFYFLSDPDLATGGTATTPYVIEATLNLSNIRAAMEQMNVPLFDIDSEPDQVGPYTSKGDGSVSFEIEAFLSDTNGAILKHVDVYNSPTGSPQTDTYYYTRFNQNLTNTIILYLNLRGTLPERRIPLYTTGGVLAYDPPPPCKYIAQVGEFTYYGNIKEESFTNANNQQKYRITEVPYRIKQSNVSDPDSVPDGNYVDLPDEVTGIAGILDRCIVATTNAIYRIDGRYDDFGSGLVSTQILTSEVGCISHRSMVVVKDKLFFCGDDGIYVTDGVFVVNISSHISRTYKQLVASIITDTSGDLLVMNTNTQDKISAVHDKTYDRVLFSFGNKVLAVELKASTLENGQGSFFGPWTTGGDETNPPQSFTTISTYQNNIIKGDVLGYVTQFSSGYLADPNMSLSAPTTWGIQPIIYRLRTAKFNFGSLVIKKWVSLLTFILKRRKVLQGGVTEIDVAIHSYNDGERTRQYLKPVHYTGTKDCVYDQDPKTGSISVPKTITDTLVNEQRRFGAGGLRCLTKSVEFTNGYHLAFKSDNYELAVTSSMFASLPVLSWPSEVVTALNPVYFICFAYDNYATKFHINSATSATLSLSSAPIAGSHKWKIYSVSATQFFGLHSFGMVYTSFGSKHESYAYNTQGGNVGDTGE
jgi:hypothetical protein